MVTGLSFYAPSLSRRPRSWPRQAGPLHCPGVLLLLALLAGTPPVLAQPEPRPLFIELASSEDRVYVQQQLILTVRLHFSANLIRGELSTPEHPDAVIEQLGRQREFNRTLDNQNYRVVERRYAVFPQAPGTLTLPPIRFEGLARHPRGHAYRISDEASLFDIEVRAIPEAFQGRQWLPARGLSLTERGLPDAADISVGDTLNRRIDITVEGLQGTTLPPLLASYPDTLRVYPEPARRQSVPGPEGINGSLEQTLALVPVEGGSLVVPEIRIHWWDVTQDEARVAVLPARRYQVTSTGTASGPDSAPGGAEVAVEPARQGAGLWPWLTLGLTIVWAGTLWQLIRIRRHPLSVTTPEPAASIGGGDRSAESVLFEDMSRQLRNGDGAWTRTLRYWLSEFRGQRLRTLEDALLFLADPELEQSLKHWQETRWRPGGPSQPDAKGSSETLIRQLQGHRARLLAERRASRQRPYGLPAF